MNTAVAAWKPLGASTLRHATTSTSSSAAWRSTASAIRSTTPRFHYSSSACTNSVRKTLYGTNHQTRLAAIHPSSSLSTARLYTNSSRFAPVIRRGFADNAAQKSSSVGKEAAATAVTKKSNGMMDKFKQMVKQYGYTGVAVYLGISCIDLAATFVVVKAMGMDKIAVAQDWVLENWGPYVGYKPKTAEEKAAAAAKSEAEKLDKVDDEQVGAIYNHASGLWSVFVIAYGIHKLLVPLRVVATGAITPPLVKWLVKKGWIKEVPKKAAAVAAGSTTAAAAAATKP
ncbi:N-terminal acetyltransferase 2 [Entomortierella parvispora]|uniref:N-terminal acetyltransferase 2 n=1 Tax=Entomortierella parvispora TaxID=205924 RepID=A0A9P3LYC9_9FUNG|nr:N-terminal acetyltransferase 2 [Entomortierella parvispora]